MDSRKKAVSQAWLDRISLGVISALAYLSIDSILSSSSWEFLAKRSPSLNFPDSDFFIITIAIVVFLLFGHILRNIGTYPNCLRSVLNLFSSSKQPAPDIHTSIIIGLTLVNAIQISVLSLSFEWHLVALPATYLIAMEIYLTFLHHLNSNKKTHINAPPTIKTIEDTTNEDFLDWLQNDNPSFQFDFYDKTSQAKRILRILTRDDSPSERGQILLGDFGSGKSTIIKSVQKKLEQEKDNPWIVLIFDSWGRSESPEDLTAMILDEIILEMHKAGIETISLQNMRSRYIQSAFKVSNRMSILEPLVTPKNPEATLEQINQLLLVNNRKLLLVIEDSDRAIESEKVIRTIAGLLDRVANFSEFRYIFTLKREAIETDIAYKVADHIEDIDTLCPKELLKKFFEFCMDDISFISPELRELNKFNEAGKLERLYTCNPPLIRTTLF